MFFQCQVKDRIRRADAAEANSLSTLALFGPSVALAHVAGVPSGTIDRFAMTYVILRGAYMFVYIWLQENRKFWILRPVVHYGSVFTAIGLYVLAGRRV